MAQIFDAKLLDDIDVATLTIEALQERADAIEAAKSVVHHIGTDNGLRGWYFDNMIKLSDNYFAAADEIERRHGTYCKYH